MLTIFQRNNTTNTAHFQSPVLLKLHTKLTTHVTSQASVHHPQQFLLLSSHPAGMAGALAYLCVCRPRGSAVHPVQRRADKSAMRGQQRAQRPLIHTARHVETRPAPAVSQGHHAQGGPSPRQRVFTTGSKQLIES